MCKTSILRLETPVFKDVKKHYSFDSHVIQN